MPNEFSLTPWSSKEAIGQLRDEAAALEMRYNTNRPFLRSNHPSSEAQDEGLDATIETLEQENAALRSRLDQFLAWEKQLDAILMERSTACALPCEISDTKTPAQSKLRVRLSKPLELAECHAIVRKVYSEIVAFSSSGKEGLVSTGASVFGWTDQRRVDKDQLKFSISKLTTRMSPEDVTSGIWALLSSPNGFNKVISQSLNMHSEVVQIVDHSNVVILQESRVHSNTGGTPTVTVVRALVLLSLFATEKGYVFVNYGLDQERVALQPNYYLSPLPDGKSIVQHVWQPMFCWGTFERVEGAPLQCLASFVGTFPVEGANYRNWAVEVLLLVLRIDGYLLAPQWILPQEEEG